MEDNAWSVFKQALHDLKTGDLDSLRETATGITELASKPRARHCETHNDIKGIYTNYVVKTPRSKEYEEDVFRVVGQLLECGCILDPNGVITYTGSEIAFVRNTRNAKYAFQVVDPGTDLEGLEYPPPLQAHLDQDDSDLEE